MIAPHLRRGRGAEALALRHLRGQGLKLVSRNFSGAMGELDMVMLDDDELVFVEVRYRGSGEFGDALETVDFNKQRKLRRTAEYFLQKHPDLPCQGCRFDVVGVTGDRVTWLKSAF